MDHESIAITLKRLVKMKRVLSVLLVGGGRLRWRPAGPAGARPLFLRQGQVPTGARARAVVPAQPWLKVPIRGAEANSGASPRGCFQGDGWSKLPKTMGSVVEILFFKK